MATPELAGAGSGVQGRGGRVKGAGVGGASRYKQSYQAALGPTRGRSHDLTLQQVTAGLAAAPDSSLVREPSPSRVERGGQPAREGGGGEQQRAGGEGGQVAVGVNVGRAPEVTVLQAQLHGAHRYLGSLRAGHSYQFDLRAARTPFRAHPWPSHPGRDALRLGLGSREAVRRFLKAGFESGRRKTEKER